jgi:hypothetical protein
MGWKTASATPVSAVTSARLNAVFSGEERR